MDDMNVTMALLRAILELINKAVLLCQEAEKSENSILRRVLGAACVREK